MSKKESFKEFVRNNKELLKYVKNEEMSWQKFYEMYDIYGEESDVWDKYIKSPEKTVKDVATIGDAFNWIKNVNLDKMQESINSIQRVIGLLEDFKGNNTTTKKEYKPRPIYKHFED